MSIQRFFQTVAAPLFQGSGAKLNANTVPLSSLVRGTNGQLPIGQTSAALAYKAASGHATIDKDGIVTLAPTLLNYVEVDISAADIVDTSAGKFAHAQGQTLIAAPGSGKAIELVSAVLSFTYSTAAFTGGGNVTVNWGAGGAAITGLVSAANSFGASANKLYQFLPLAAAANAMVSNAALSLVAASAFTQPGTAAGSAKVFISYRVHTL